MTRKEVQKVVVTEKNPNTRNAVETAIDLSKDNIHGTWEEHASGLSKRIKPWLLEVQSQTRSWPKEK